MSGSLRPAAALATALAVLSVVPAVAEEAGSGHYLPGTAGTLADAPPTRPGFLALPFFYYYSGDVSASRQLPVGDAITAGLSADVAGFIPGGVYTFDQRILGAFYTIGASIPLLDLDVEANVAAPLGSVTRRDRATGLSDIVLIPAMLGWKIGNTMTLPPNCPRS